MNKFLVFILIAAFIIACGESNTEESAATSPPATSSPTTASAAEKPDGEKIYKQYCISCHGLYGDMGASGAFNLKESALTLEERIQVITNGRNTMVSFKPLLKPEQIQAVGEYTMTLSKAE